MNTGKQKCEFLKRIRREVAERYGLAYTQSECSYKGECGGTCPKCDSELQELQRQLEDRGIKEVDLVDIQHGTEAPKEETYPLEGDVVLTNENEYMKSTMGMPMPPYTYWRKKRVLYKACKIAGITFHDLKDVWDELYVGAKLALVRQRDNKYDKNAIAVALAGDYDGNPDDFDFNFILGYVPRTDNEHLALMMDMGWAEAFDCELSQVNGPNPYKGSLYMNIYIVSKEGYEEEDTQNLLRAIELDDVAYNQFIDDLNTKGCSYFRFGGFPPWQHNFPKRGEKVVFIHRQDEYAQLYLMHCIAVGDDDASYFVEEKESLNADDDCCYYVFTNIKGPVLIHKENLSFLDSESIHNHQPEEFLLAEASCRLHQLLDTQRQ